MIKKLLAFPLALALAICVCSVSVFADGTKSAEPAASREVKATSEKATSKADAKLKNDMEQLLADAKAGKVAPAQQKFPRTAKNNLSKTTKIAILAAAVGSAIFLAILFHDLSKD
jgi:hypothetical protein